MNSRNSYSSQDPFFSSRQPATPGDFGQSRSDNEGQAKSGKQSTHGSAVDARSERQGPRTKRSQTRTKKTRSCDDEKIRASEVRYRRLFEAAEDGILILEAEEGRIEDANPFLMKLLGFSFYEIMGKTIAELSPFKDPETHGTMLERLQQDRYARYEDVPLKTKDGRHIEVEFLCNLYRAGDRDVIQCNIRDMTERNRATAQVRSLNAELKQWILERTAQLRSNGEEVAAFRYSVSHNLRAPLRHILGFVDVLKEDSGPLLSEKDLGLLTTIAQAAWRMGNSIDDLLAFSRAGHLEMETTEVDLGELVQEVVSEFHEEIKERDIAWKIHPLPLVWADRPLLRIALVNLISNALKFTGIRAIAKIEIGCASSGDGEAVIFIRDNGAGFDSRYAARLFGLFQRLHTRTEFEGTGLGLANVHRIIRRHGGRTWAEGMVGRGALICFSIPEKKDTTNESSTSYPASGG